ncbi:HIT family protein [Xanthomonas hortorum]|uniref:HIT family protein n=1 Tax=Xanthomonas hortorum TaxID=56454 RepID=UPI0012A81041|nr:HIT domain-containing protein [Xanthomonas hortorum]MDT7819550.1 HIT domain-containing protein [Xanthomonas hortorum pv. vitians]NMI39024.1 HIT domain-containing protein [Xanthomonas hortorum pv. vitians]QEW16319.1 HIT domain-containing protein [Xanthomonas hortorum]
MTNSSIELPKHETCAFCSYLRGDRPYTILCRDDMTATLVTREQRGKPHLLVIPLKHCPTILDLEDEYAKALILSVREAARLIDAAYGRPGIAVWQNNGIDARQTIGHVHFHVAGTMDDGGTLWGDVEELPLSETEKIAAFLKNYLA